MKLLCLILLWISCENTTQELYTDPDYPNFIFNDEKRLNYSSTSLQKICIKEHTDSKNKHDAIKIDAKNFKDLVRHSDIYVDKSLFIKPIIMSNEPVISFTYPRKWGKSTNLDMVKTFLEIEVDSEGKPIPIESTWSYQYFKRGRIGLENGDSVTLERPPYIHRHKYHIDKFLARYPVIYLDLSASRPTSNDLDGLFQAFRNAIVTAFGKHEYLGKVLEQEKQKETFEKYKKGENRGIEEMINSLQFLSKLLFDQFKKRVFIFVDGYDYMIEQAFFTVSSRIELKDAEKFLDFYSKFLHNTFEANKDHLRTGVLTGVFNVNHCFQKNGLKDIVNYNMLNKNLEPFYGFTMQEVEQLYHELDITAKQMKEMFDWHSGYHLGDYPKVTVFNSWFIVNFANIRKLENSWAKIWSHDILPKTLKLKSTRKFLQAVISGSADAKIDRSTLDLNVDDIKFLKSVATDEIHNTPSNRFTSIFILFYTAGYFSLDIESIYYASSLKEIPILIPCKGTLSIIVDELKNYYREKFGDSVCRSAQKVARGLLTTLHLKGGMNPVLSAPLDNLYKRLPVNFYNIDQETVDEAHFLALLFVKSNYNFNIGLNVVYYDDEKKPQTLYMTIYSHDIGVVYSYRYMESSFDFASGIYGCLQSNPHYYFFQSKHVKMIRHGVLQIATGNAKFSNVAFGCPPSVWSETEKKFIRIKRWSYNLPAFRDYNEGLDMDSSDDRKCAIDHHGSLNYWEQQFSKPYFDTSTERELTATAGQTALLPCKVRNLGDRAVSWIRKGDLHILTVGILTYTNDQRFQTLHSDGTDEWTLRITSTQVQDSGTYECQVSTEPKISLAFKLNVVISKAQIIGNSEIFVKSGSDINLTCVVVQSPEPPSFIYWYKNDNVINYSSRGGINVLTEKQTKTSRLLISRAQPPDSGNYTCSPSSSESASVLVHVLNGEHPAAMQHGNSSTSGVSKLLPVVLILLCHVTKAFLLQDTIIRYRKNR